MLLSEQHLRRLLALLIAVLLVSGCTTSQTPAGALAGAGSPVAPSPAAAAQPDSLASFFKAMTAGVERLLAGARIAAIEAPLPTVEAISGSGGLQTISPDGPPPEPPATEPSIFSITAQVLRRSFDLR